MVPPCLVPARVRAGLQSHLHQDGFDNLLVVMAGRKDVVLISSAETDAVYADDFAYAAGISPVYPWLGLDFDESSPP